MIIYPNGLGGENTVALGRDDAVYASARVWYLDSANGDNANDGTSASSPKQTLANVVAAASEGDVVFLMNGFSEELGATLTFTSGLTFIGEGLSGGEPTAEIGFDDAGEIVVTAAHGLAFHNVRFSGRSAAESGGTVRIAVTGTVGFRLIDCLVECDDHDVSAAVTVDDTSSSADFRGSIFRSVADTTAPGPGLQLEGDAHVLSDCIFDGGTVGFDDVACDLSQSALTAVAAWGNTLKGGAVVKIEGDSVGVFQFAATQGAGTVELS